MKKLFFFFYGLSVAFAGPVSAQNTAQELPATTLVPHYHLSISYNTTTVLIFPAAVKPVDRGDRDLLAQKQSEVDNVLKLKAAHPHIGPTNLHVFTADGRIYCFDISYTDSPATTHNLTSLITGITPGPRVLLTDEPINTEDMAVLVQKTKALPGHHIATARDSRMKLRLETIGLANGLMFLRLHLANHSDLDYHIDFVRLYIRDHQQIKRSSVQETEASPVYEDTACLVPGRHSLTHVIAIPAFSLAANKRFFIEVYEKNGGRSLTLELKNKQLFRVNKL